MAAYMYSCCCGFWACAHGVLARLRTPLPLPRSCLALLPRPGMKRETNALHEGLLGAQLPWERRWARRGGVRRCCCLICRCNLAPGVAFGSLLVILNSLFLLWFAGGFAFDPNHGFVFRMITFFQFMAALVRPRAPPPSATNGGASAVGQCKRLCGLLLTSAHPFLAVAMSPAGPHPDSLQRDRGAGL
eukprot:COSAG01_NODE_3800_length_5685_cov_4.802542_1_plen_188_part_00